MLHTQHRQRLTLACFWYRELFMQEAVSWHSVSHRESLNLNHIELHDCVVHSKCPSSQSNLWTVLQEARL